MKFNSQHLSSYVLIVSLLFLLNGCWGNPRPADLPQLYPCTITITQDGKGLDGAFVMLHSTSAEPRWVVAGNTDAGGVVRLSTHGKFAGVPAGGYKIVVTKTERVKKGNAPVKLTPEGTEEAAPVDIYYLVEKQYTDISTTPLTIEVEKGQNSQTFDVGKAVREKSNIIVL